MGQINCTSCESNFDLKTEMDLKSSIIKSLHQPVESSRPSTQASTSVELDPYFLEHAGALTAIQAWWRSRQERKAVQHLLKSQGQPNSYFSKTYVFETVRVGQRIPKVAQAKPTFCYRSGAQYTGSWLGGFRHGEGTMVWSDGARYEGDWSFGHAAGRGTFMLPSGESFTGKWMYRLSFMRTSLMLDSPRSGGCQPEDGYGKVYSVWLAQMEVLSLPSRTQLTRTWQANKKAALEESLESFHDLLSSRKKRFRGGGRQRVEDLEVKDGVYCGEVKDGIRDGWGKNKWNNGDVYEGEWEDDQHNGFGVSHWTDGSHHEGFYKENKKDGVGEYMWQDGSRYLGEWKDNQMHGKGRYSWIDGRTYLGEWVNGLMHGFGVFVWKDERRYEGGWYQGKKHGEGVTFTPDGRYTRDVWRYGKIAKPDC